ncbi:unnamed protein product [Arctia plantaginis]|uniref:Uncharacterized protein n=1 Tax=Arctia plantaginis TaxID=874455 RepID=A0A8S1A518_ARCPL|nr:unnamed protein product [Arctia plantaginis]
MRDEEPPLPPATPSPARSGPSRLRRTLHTLQTPFRSGSPFHIGLIKRTGSSKSVASDSEITRDERTMRKRNKKQREADAAVSDASRSTDSSPSIDKKKKEGGSFIRRMGSIGKKRETGQTSQTSQSQTRAGPANADNPTNPTQDNITSEPIINKAVAPESATPKPETPEPATSKPATSDPATPEPTTPDPVIPEPVSPIAVEHPVATRLFTKAAWKRNTAVEMEKPVEEPSPENALRRRIAFVTQASVALSEDHDDGERGGAKVGSLEEAVALARERLAVPTPPSPAQSCDDNTEEEGYTDAMPAYGDLIESVGHGTSVSV